MIARMASSCALVFVLSIGRVAVAGPEEADAIQKKAMAAYALGHYAEAADDYERAFALKPEPGLLYNAAQAHRLAGQKERALALYENYVRVFGSRAEVDKRIVELKQAIAQEKAAAPMPPPVEAPPASKTEAPAPAAPPTPAPAAAPPAPAATVAPAAVLVAPPPAPPAATQPAGVVVAQPATTDDQGSVVKKPWFWIVVGGGVALVVASLLLLSGGTKDPTPSIGHANGN